MTLRPSTADSTEIAGVIMLSPENSAAPKMPSVASTNARRPPRAPKRRTRAMSAMMPPSPSLSARMTSGDVGQRHDDHHRPENQRHNTVDVVRGDRHGVGVAGIEERLDGIDRAGSDVAEHDAEGADHKGQADPLPASDCANA